MRVLLIGLNYLPESTSIGPYSSGLAEHLVRQGHDVQVITGFPMAPQWRVWDGYRGRLTMRETINGVNVLRTYLYVPKNPSRAIKRILFDTSFALSSLIAGLFVRRADVVVVVSPPLQLGITGWLLGLRHRAKVMLHLQDLVPDAAVAVGILKADSRAARFARALESFVYKRVASIGVICDGFRRNLEGKKADIQKLRILPNYIDLDSFKPGERVNGFRQQHGIGAGEFLVMYSGSIAMKQGLGTFVEAAGRIDATTGVRCYLVGEGPYISDLRIAAAALSNFFFLPLQPRETLAEQLTSADVLVVTQRRAVTDVVFPGKLLYYMAAGRPILAAVAAQSETGLFITSRQVGMVVPPEDPQALADAILYLKDNPDKAAAFGRNGRRIVEECFDQRVVLRQFEAELQSLATGAFRLEKVLKRLLDIGIALFACIVFAPVFALVALAIRLSSPGPVLYRWPVVGEHGRRLRAYKFRTMVVDAEQMKDSLRLLNESTWPFFKLRNDPRVTKIGAFLRRFSLDELPQLWSILAGDMSLVGPRPVLVTEWRHFTPEQRRKLSVKPGAISLWHVDGQPRDLESWLRLDFEYIDHWSLSLDFRILRKAFGYVLLGRNC